MKFPFRCILFGVCCTWDFVVASNDSNTSSFLSVELEKREDINHQAQQKSRSRRIRRLQEVPHASTTVAVQCEVDLQTCTTNTAQTDLSTLSIVASSIDPTGSLAGAVFALLRSLASGEGLDVPGLVAVIGILLSETEITSVLGNLFNGGNSDEGADEERNGLNILGLVSLILGGGNLGDIIAAIVNGVLADGNGRREMQSSPDLFHQLDVSEKNLQGLIDTAASTLEPADANVLIAVVRTYLDLIGNLVNGSSADSLGSASVDTESEVKDDDENRKHRRLLQTRKGKRVMKKTRSSRSSDSSDAQSEDDGRDEESSDELSEADEMETSTKPLIRNSKIHDIMALLSAGPEVLVPHEDHFHTISIVEEATTIAKAEADVVYRAFNDIATGALFLYNGDSESSGLIPSLRTLLMTDFAMSLIDALVAYLISSLPQIRGHGNAPAYDGPFAYVSEFMALSSKSISDDNADNDFFVGSILEVVASLAVFQGVYAYLGDSFPQLFESTMEPNLQRMVVGIEAQMRDVMQDLDSTIDMHNDPTISADQVNIAVDEITCRLELISCETIESAIL